MELKKVVVVALVVVWVVMVEGVKGADEVVVEGCTAPLVLFGASMADVGENSMAKPWSSAADFVPYGVDYFGAPAGRFSNGRVISDFISLGLGYGLMEPYLNSVNPQFAHGINFASAGSTAQNNTSGSSTAQGSGLFPLNMQLTQYKSFKARVKKVQTKHKGSISSLPTITKLDNAIHVMMSGDNDYLNNFVGIAPSDYENLVTKVVAAIGSSLEELYSMGAKTMIVANVLPLGCTPGTIASMVPSGWALDNNSCLTNLTTLVTLHNTRLEELINNLHKKHSWDGLVVFDFYAFYMEALLNPSKYDVKYPFQACCGVGGGKYNYYRSITCGNKGMNNGEEVEAVQCESPTEHISWDGLHPVESFAKYVANAFLHGHYFSPSLSIKDACKA